jgi:hypothetical protein
MALCADRHLYSRYPYVTGVTLFVPTLGANLTEMAENNQHEPRLEVAATAYNGAEADLMCQRLAEAGIRATSQRSIGGPQWGGSGAQYVYVEAEHLDRARAVLAAPEDISDEGLPAMAENAAPTQSEGDGGAR